MHFGTPCTTYSQARRNDGGPRPLRTQDWLRGLPHLEPWERAKVEEGTFFMELTILWIRAGGPELVWSVENPANSMLWLTPEFKQLQQDTGAVLYLLDACAYGSPHKKPTGWMSNDSNFQHMEAHCPGNHHHDEL